MPADADRDEIEARKSAERIRKALARVEANLAQSGQGMPKEPLVCPDHLSALPAANLSWPSGANDEV